MALLKAELATKKKAKVSAVVGGEKRAWDYMGEIHDRDGQLRLKQTEMADLRRKLKEAESELKSANASGCGNSFSLPFFAGIPPTDTASRRKMQMLEEEVAHLNSEVNVLRAWNR